MTQDVLPVTTTRAETQASYDRLSGMYDMLEGDWEKGLRQQGRRVLNARRGEHVLDIGFATGQGILDLVNAVGETGFVAGVDLSSKMGEITREKIMAQHFETRAAVVCGDGSAQPFAAESFDAIFTSFTLELFDTPQIPRVLQECARLLRPGGRLCVVSLSKEAGHDTARKIYEWLHEKFPKLIDCRPIYARRSIESAGYKILVAEPHDIWGLPVQIVLAQKA